MNKQPTRAYWLRQIRGVEQGKDRSKSKRKKRVKRRGFGGRAGRIPHGGTVRMGRLSHKGA